METTFVNTQATCSSIWMELKEQTWTITKTIILIAFLFMMNDISASAQAAQQTFLKLNNGVMMPQFGLGVYSIPDKRCEETTLAAIKAGYRHIDTAHAYGNERAVGKAVKESGVSRDSLWITSKLWPNEYGVDTTMAALKRMLKRLGLDYLDMVYLHQPVGDYRGAWKDLVKAQKMGLVKAIGISDFDASDSVFHSLMDSIDVLPQTLQIECHPYAQREHWQEVARKYNVQIECWFPLGGRDSKGEILRDPVINEIAKAHGKTAAQVILRWHIQKGFSVIPGIDKMEYIPEDISIFDFTLTDEEMERIHKLNKERRYFNMPYEQQKAVFGSYKLYD
jgi:diketogulonate reductase-like aldo/keto reductase